MPEEISCNDRCVYVWTGEREIWPCYEKLLVLGKETDCLSEVEELWETQKLILVESDELLGALSVEKPGSYKTIVIPEDFDSCLILICERATLLLDDGYLRIDPWVSDQTTRPIFERITRRRARQLYLCRVISEKRRVKLPGVTPPPSEIPPGPPSIPPGRTEYIVQAGDTMFLIARRFGLTLDELIRANPQLRNPEMIFPGEIIYIPRRAQPGPAPGPGPGPGPRRYVVRQGDTIYSIAERFGLTVSELLAFNPQITDTSRLTPGQVIFIPATGALG